MRTRTVCLKTSLEHQRSTKSAFSSTSLLPSLIFSTPCQFCFVHVWASTMYFFSFFALHVFFPSFHFSSNSIFKQSKKKKRRNKKRTNQFRVAFYFYYSTRRVSLSLFFSFLYCFSCPFTMLLFFLNRE